MIMRLGSEGRPRGACHERPGRSCLEWRRPRCSLTYCISYRSLRIGRTAQKRKSQLHAHFHRRWIGEHVGVRFENRRIAYRTAEALFGDTAESVTAGHRVRLVARDLDHALGLEGLGGAAHRRVVLKQQRRARGIPEPSLGDTLQGLPAGDRVVEVAFLVPLLLCRRPAATAVSSCGLSILLGSSTEAAVSSARRPPTTASLNAATRTRPRATTAVAAVNSVRRRARRIRAIMRSSCTRSLDGAGRVGDSRKSSGPAIIEFLGSTAARGRPLQGRGQLHCATRRGALRDHASHLSPQQVVRESLQLPQLRGLQSLQLVTKTIVGSRGRSAAGAAWRRPRRRSRDRSSGHGLRHRDRVPLAHGTRAHSRWVRRSSESCGCGRRLRRTRTPRLRCDRGRQNGRSCCHGRRGRRSSSGRRRVRRWGCAAIGAVERATGAGAGACRGDLALPQTHRDLCLADADAISMVELDVADPLTVDRCAIRGAHIDQAHPLDAELDDGVHPGRGPVL